MLSLTMRRQQISLHSSLPLVHRALRTICAPKSWSKPHLSGKIAPTNPLISARSAHIERNSHLIESTEHQATCFHIHAHTFPGSPLDSAFYELGTGGIVGSDREPRQNRCGGHNLSAVAGAAIVATSKKLPNYVAAAFRPP